MNEQHALLEILANHENKDLIKARAVIDNLAEIDLSERKRVFFEFTKLDDDFVLPLLAYLKHKHPALVAESPQIYQMLIEKSVANPSQLLKCLVTLTPETIVFIELIEKSEIREVLPRLRQILSQSEDTKLLTATIRTLGNLIDTNAVQPIAEFISSENENLQQAALEALEKIGSEKALKSLYSSLGADSKLDDRILTIFKELASEIAIHFLVKTLVSDNATLRILGKSKLEELGTAAIPALSANLQGNNPDLQIHTLNILLNIGNQAAVKAIRRLLNTEPENANVRFAAFEALAHLPSLKGDYLLATGLNDKDSSIRLAAAKAVEKNLDPVLIGGIKNMVNTENAEAVRIIKAIVDAEAGELFLSLLDIPFFYRISTEYIAAKVHQSVREYFIKLLEARKNTETAAQIAQQAKVHNKQKSRKLICAVDDSLMILSVYRRVLNELGFEPVLFEFPEECLFWLAEKKATAVFTDLNMPKITGIELSKRIREQYDAATLPIIMVTTQQDGINESELNEVGINRIMSKPFDSDSIKDALSALSISN